MKSKEVEYFLHELGYTYHSMHSLTPKEVNRLVEVSDKRNKDMERKQKDAERKNKRKR